MPDTETVTSAAPLLLRLQSITGWVAIAGGALALAVAGLVVVSILGRWLLDGPVSGDFEYVQMATAAAVFAWLPYTQARGGNIAVDTFSARLPRAVTTALDAFWCLAYAGTLAFGAVALMHGALDARQSGETTMMVQIPLWPIIAIVAVLCTLAAATAALTALLHFRGRGPGAWP